MDTGLPLACLSLPWSLDLWIQAPRRGGSAGGPRPFREPARRPAPQARVRAGRGGVGFRAPRCPQHCGLFTLNCSHGEVSGGLAAGLLPVGLNVHGQHWELSGSEQNGTRFWRRECCAFGGSALVRNVWRPCPGSRHGSGRCLREPDGPLTAGVTSAAEQRPLSVCDGVAPASKPRS